MAVFENLFPALTSGDLTPPTLTPEADDAPPLYVPTRPGLGACEVVVFTQDPASALGRLPLWHLELLFAVWADRVRELGARAEVEYVMPFENRGEEVGVTLHHPHGQIYAYPFVPPLPAREHAEARAFFEHQGRTLLADVVEHEEADGRRMLYAGRARSPSSRPSRATPTRRGSPRAARRPRSPTSTPRTGPTSRARSRRCC